MGELGRKLKEAREEKGLSVRQVEETTKIRKKYLLALENENFEEIPGRTYARGFVKNYSNFLHLNTSELLTEFDELTFNLFKDREFNSVRDTSRSTPSTSLDKEGRLFKVGLIVIVILVLFIAGKTLNNDGGEAVPNNLPEANNSSNTENNETPSSKAPEVSTEPKETQPAEAITGVKLEIEIIKDQCWVSVVSDGNEIFAGTLNKGAKQVFEGDNEIVLTLGNAGAAKVTYNGEELAPLGEDGEVVTPSPFVSSKPQT